MIYNIGYKGGVIMKYKKLEILTYERADIDRELCLRKNPYLTTFLNFTINPIVRGEKITNQVYELFFNQIPPITSLSEKIMKQSSQIKDLNNSIYVYIFASNNLMIGIDYRIVAIIFWGRIRL